MTANTPQTNTLPFRIYHTTMGWTHRFRLPHKASPSSLSEAEVPVHKDEKRIKVAPWAPPATTKDTAVVDTTISSATRVAPAERKQVRFSDVQVRRYNRILGDNPYAEIPLAIGWLYSLESTSSVDKHEEHQLEDEYINAHHMEPLEIDQRIEKLLAVGLSRDSIYREERRRSLMIAQEWQFRIDPTDTTPCTCRHGKILIQRYLTV